MDDQDFYRLSISFEKAKRAGIDPYDLMLGTIYRVLIKCFPMELVGCILSYFPSIVNDNRKLFELGFVHPSNMYNVWAEWRCIRYSKLVWWARAGSVGNFNPHRIYPGEHFRDLVDRLVGNYTTDISQDIFDTFGPIDWGRLSSDPRIIWGTVQKNNNDNGDDNDGDDLPDLVSGSPERIIDYLPVFINHDESGEDESGEDESGEDTD